MRAFKIEVLHRRDFIRREIVAITQVPDVSRQPFRVPALQHLGPKAQRLEMRRAINGQNVGVSEKSRPRIQWERQIFIGGHAYRVQAYQNTRMNESGQPR